MPHVTLSCELRTAGIYTEFLVDHNCNDNLHLPDNADSALKILVLSVVNGCKIMPKHAVENGEIVSYYTAFTNAVLEHLETEKVRKQKQQEEQKALEEACKELFKQVQDWSERVNLFDLVSIMKKEFNSKVDSSNIVLVAKYRQHILDSPSVVWSSPNITTNYDIQIRQKMQYVLSQAQGIAKAINEQAEIKAKALLCQKYNNVKLYTRIGKAYKLVS